MSNTKLWNRFFNISKFSALIFSEPAAMELMMRTPSNKWAISIGVFKSSFMASKQFACKVAMSTVFSLDAFNLLSCETAAIIRS